MLAALKIIHFSLITAIPRARILELKNIQKCFFWFRGTHKVKHSTLCRNYENKSLKSVDILSRGTSLQCSWIRAVYEKMFQCWKIIPL